VTLLGTYVPRQCGIATFTDDLARVFSELQGEALDRGSLVRVLAVNSPGSDLEYGPQVRFEIREAHIADYGEAAGFVNVSPANAVSLQHEFGIFGGEAGRHVLAFLSGVRKPVVTTLHTILGDDSENVYARTLPELSDLSTFVVAMSERGREMLIEYHGVDPEKVRVIPHGVPEVPFLDPGFYKDQFKLEGRKVVLTFGLLSPHKGIETVIEALALLVKEHPDVAYIVLGATHPEVRKQEGEAYRSRLEQLTKSLGLSDNVFFYNRYVTLDELLEFILASDVYVTPYLNKEQITSGTLSYALGCGKAVVSTPYWHAEELLADGRGVIVPFSDPEATAAAIGELLSDEVRRNQMRKRGYQFSRSMVWREVGRRYLELFEEAIDRQAELVRPVAAPRRVIPEPPAPEVLLDHVARLTDETGVLHRAAFATPDRRGGYSTDDNALALIVAVDDWRTFEDPAVPPLVHTYLSFLHYALDERTGSCRGRLSYERRWLDDDEGSRERTTGRVLWALGQTVGHPPSEAALALAAQMFSRMLPRAERFEDPSAVACAIVGIHRYLIRFSGASEVRRLREALASRLFGLLERGRGPDWPWCSDRVGPEAGHVPHALLLSGRWLERGEMVGAGLEALGWLFEVQTDPQTGNLSPIGDRGGMTRGGERARFDQRPREVAALAGASEEAFLITKEAVWASRVSTCLSWFLGANDRLEPLYDFKTKGVSDGVEATGLSPDQGARATLSWLMTLLAAHRVEEEQARLGAGAPPEEAEGASSVPQQRRRESCSPPRPNCA
jgi:glycosyltransferase involved in cell wall biosynthesis